MQVHMFLATRNPASQSVYLASGTREQTDVLLPVASCFILVISIHRHKHMCTHTCAHANTTPHLYHWGLHELHQS